MAFRHTYRGACHCQNIQIRLESDRTPLELGLRSDSCSFCTKHQALYTSDPAGAVHLVCRDERLVERYRFGTKTAEFLVCKVCGVFVAACMFEPSSSSSPLSVAVVNVHVLADRAAFLANPVQIASFETESSEQRLARRRAKWTPVISFVVT